MRAQGFFYLLPAMHVAFALIFFGIWRAERLPAARLAAIGSALSIVAIPLDMMRAPMFPFPWSYGFLLAVALHWISLWVISNAFLARHGERLDSRYPAAVIALGGVGVALTTFAGAAEERIVVVALTAAAMLVPALIRLRRRNGTPLDRVIALFIFLSLLSYLGRAATLKLSTMGAEVASAPVFSSYWNFFYLLVAIAALLGALLMTMALTVDLTHRSRDRSHRDALTGVANRRALEDIADRHGRIGAVVMIDLDHFKSINDTHGHSVGDEVLRRVARAIEHSTNDGTVVRMGGEEFAVLVPRGCDGVELAHRLREALARLEMEHDGRSVPVTASVGVARQDAANPLAGLDQLLGEADAALYAAKNGGRNRVVVHQRAA